MEGRDQATAATARARKTAPRVPSRSRTRAPADRAQAAPEPQQELDPRQAEVARVKVELDRSNAVLRRLLRELDDRGPNSPGVPQIWEAVRKAATASDQLIQRLDRLREDLETSRQ